MTRYADPRKCPDCLGPIEYGAPGCATCGLPLQGPVAQRLFETLSHADELLTTLRAAPVVTPVAPPVGVAAGVSAAASGATGSAPAGAAGSTPPLHPGHTPPPGRTGGGLSAASVPKILLGLGAGCVLVAALVFLAVTWSVMGVAGRTATLVGFTVVAGGLAGWMARRGLRGAAESLTLVALGLLTLDVFGARHAGWLGDVSDPGFLVLLGALLASVGAAAALRVRRTPATALTGAELVAATGLALLATGVASGDWAATSAALVAAVVVSAAAALTAQRLRLLFTAVGAAVVTGCTWLVLTGTALERAGGHDTVRELWLGLEGWPLLAAAALAAVPALSSRVPTAGRVGALAVAGLLVAGLGVLPFDAGSTQTTLAMLVLLLVAGAPAWLLPRPWGLSSSLALALGGVWMLRLAAELGLESAERFLRAGSAAWTGEPGDRLPASFAQLPPAWLLPLAVAALVGTAVVAARSTGTLDRLRGTPAATTTMAEPAPTTGASTARSAAAPAGVALLAATGVATLVLYPVPVWLVLAVLLVVAGGFTAWALTRRGLPALLPGAAFLGAGLLVSLHDEWLSAVALTLAVVLAAVVHLRWRTAEVSAVAGILLATAAGCATWAWGSVAGGPGEWLALWAVALMAVLAVGVPFLGDRLWSCPSVGFARSGVEIGAAGSAFVSGVAGVAAAPAGAAPTWAAVYLTIAGVAVTTIALLRADRRGLSWLGGGLLALASWVRLWDVGVHAPEAYTLPSAVALVLVGLAHLRRHPGSGTMAALAPGLSLAIAPSLLWALADPVAARSVVLGAGCLALLLAGLRLRWTAPVVLGATAGALLVLRLAAPFVDGSVPRWVLIGAAGALLIGTGVTWERRLQEARQLMGYVRTLR